MASIDYFVDFIMHWHNYFDLMSSLIFIANIHIYIYITWFCCHGNHVVLIITNLISWTNKSLSSGMLQCAISEYKLFALLVNLQAFLSPPNFFSNLTFSKNSFRTIIRVSNSRNIEPDLDPNCLQSHQQTSLVGKELTYVP